MDEEEEVEEMAEEVAEEALHSAGIRVSAVEQERPAPRRLSTRALIFQSSRCPRDRRRRS